MYTMLLPERCPKTPLAGPKSVKTARALLRAARRSAGRVEVDVAAGVGGELDLEGDVEAGVEHEEGSDRVVEETKGRASANERVGRPVRRQRVERGEQQEEAREGPLRTGTSTLNYNASTSPETPIAWAGSRTRYARRR